MSSWLSATLSAAIFKNTIISTSTLRTMFIFFMSLKIPFCRSVFWFSGGEPHVLNRVEAPHVKFMRNNSHPDRATSHIEGKSLGCLKIKLQSCICMLLSSHVLHHAQTWLWESSSLGSSYRSAVFYEYRAAFITSLRSLSKGSLNVFPPVSDKSICLMILFNTSILKLLDLQWQRVKMVKII